jgi:CelD/BcsL family acetyltransferase involved in cellulose biosynthesis
MSGPETPSLGPRASTRAAPEVAATPSEKDERAWTRAVPVKTPAIDRFDGLDALEAVRADWADLWARAGGSAFEHPAWLLPWAQAYAPDRTFALGLREGGRLEALLALFTWRGTLMLAGTGPSDRGDVLVAPGRAGLAPALLAEAARAAEAAGCAAIDLEQLPPGSALFTAATPPGWASVVEPGEPCAVAPVAGPDGLGAMLREPRRSLKQTRRRAEDAGGVVIRRAGREDLARALAELERLHGARWTAAQEPGVLADPLARAHLNASAPELLEAGLLRLFTLEHAGCVRGAVLALHAGRTLAFYVSGYDPEMRALGAGTLLIAHAIEQAAAEGAAEADFLRGEEPYKLRWGAVSRPTFRRLLTLVR